MNNITFEDIEPFVCAFYSLSCDKCNELIEGDQSEWLAKDALKKGWGVNDNGEGVLCPDCLAKQEVSDEA